MRFRRRLGLRGPAGILCPNRFREGLVVPVPGGGVVGAGRVRVWNRLVHGMGRAQSRIAHRNWFALNGLRRIWVRFVFCLHAAARGLGFGVWDGLGAGLGVGLVGQRRGAGFRFRFVSGFGLDFGFDFDFGGGEFAVFAEDAVEGVFGGVFEATEFDLGWGDLEGGDLLVDVAEGGEVVGVVVVLCFEEVEAIEGVVDVLEDEGAEDIGSGLGFEAGAVSGASAGDGAFLVEARVVVGEEGEVGASELDEGVGEARGCGFPVAKAGQGAEVAEGGFGEEAAVEEAVSQGHPFFLEPGDADGERLELKEGLAGGGVEEFEELFEAGLVVGRGDGGGCAGFDGFEDIEAGALFDARGGEGEAVEEAFGLRQTHVQIGAPDLAVDGESGPEVFGEDDARAGEAVLEGVLAGLGLALGCGGAGGFLGVRAAGFNLPLGCARAFGRGFARRTGFRG